MNWKEARRYLPYLVVVLILWSFAMTKDYEYAQVQSSMKAEHAAALLAGCMDSGLNGDHARIDWTEPHSGMSMSTLCFTYAITGAR